MSTAFESIRLACKVEGCPYSEGYATVASPETLTENDAVLLNRLAEEKDLLHFSPWEKDRLASLLNQVLWCPIHGHGHPIGFITRYKVSVTAEFTIGADGNLED